MEETRKLQVATQFKNLAEISLQRGDFSDACFCYINCLKVLPEWKNELKSRFISILSHLGLLLEERKQFDEIFIIYEEALKLYDDCEQVYHNLGAHLFSLGYPDKAAFYFKKALKVKDDYFPAYRGLQSTYCALVERWHYRMLNDSLRNVSYKRAIIRRINQGFDTILDIGTGTGLLCLYALEGGAKKVYGCDYNPLMISIASQVLRENSISDRINLLEKHSNRISIPDDIPEKVTLVVTEIMDSCMLGEGLLQTLKYTWQHLLRPPYNLNLNDMTNHSQGVVIPLSGSLWFSTVQSKQLARKYMFPLSNSSKNDDYVNAFANITLRDSMPDNFKALNLQGLELFVDLNEPYDTERLQLLSDCSFSTCSNVLFHVNFNSLEDIEKNLEQDCKRSFEIVCNNEGYFHAIAAWFEVQLDEHTVLNSAPDHANSKNCCWDQAIFPNRRAYQIVPGSRISISSDWTDGKVSFQVDQITYLDGSTPYDQARSIKASSNAVSQLNDTHLVEHLKKAAVKFLKSHEFGSHLRILDLFTVPIFGLTILNNIHLINRALDEVKLICVVESVDDVELIEKILECNCIPISNVTCITNSNFVSYLSEISSPYFDVIMMNLLCNEGDMNDNTIDLMKILRPTLETGGIFLPKKVEIRSKLVNSNYIEKNMRVIDEDVSNLGIARAINEFEVAQMVEVNLSQIEFDEYSNTFVCHQFSVDNLGSELSKEFFVTIKRRGMVNSTIYWYNVYFSDDDDSYSTFENFSYVHQAAFLAKTSISFENNENAVLQFIYRHGIFIITVKNPNDCSF